MRLSYARWLIEFIEEHGVGLEKGEYAEWQEAEFRVRGPLSLPRSEQSIVQSDLVIDNVVLAWEPEVLASMAHELIDALATIGGDGSTNDEP